MGKVFQRRGTEAGAAAALPAELIRPGPGEDGLAIPFVSLRGITKSYSGVPVLRSVDLDVQAATVHALVGENGAGKSTLSKIISGIIQPDVGDIRIDGVPTSLRGPAAARHLGVSFVPQELSIVPALSLAENICMGVLPARAGVVNRRALLQRAGAILESLSLPFDPRSPLGTHSPGVQQLVMIARGLVRDARLFILDEPTAALTDAEVDMLFDVIRQSRLAGSSFIYISHRLQELDEIADQVTVLRDGQRVFTRPYRSVTADETIRAMVGRSVSRFFTTDRADDPGSEAISPSSRVPMLSVKGLSRAGVFENVTFDVEAGTIVGLAGLLGAGRTEVVRSIFGIDRLERGTIAVGGQTVRIRSPRDAMRAGISLVPEERKSQALVLGMSVQNNMVAPHLSKFSYKGWLRERSAASAAEGMRSTLDIRSQGIQGPVGSLSGGNQQKVVIGRSLLGGGRIYLFDEPTRGVDIGAKHGIYEVLGRLARAGNALLVVSSELPELIGICDRILVMRDGQLAASLQSSEFDEETILSAAMGHEEATVT